MQLQQFHSILHRMFPSENLKISSLRLLLQAEERSWHLLVSSHILHQEGENLPINNRYQ